MRIGIDARMYGPEVGGGGLGRYVEQLVNHLPEIDHQNRYVLFVGEKSLSAKNTQSLHPSITTPIHWYTLKEQLFLAPLIDKQKLDLVHFPHWNVPIGLRTPFVVTIHDLILLEEPRSARATTRNSLFYAIKYFAFKKVLEHAINKSVKIITPSNATKQSILKYFPSVDQKKISVIYEGVTALPSRTSRPSGPSGSSRPFSFLLYIGNCYPHKNLETLLSAFTILHEQIPDLHLVIAGRNDVFFKKLKERSFAIAQDDTNVTSFIHFEENPTDERLAELYGQAELYVFPSRVEGFGLPPLEAMSQSTPVACSDIPSLREILGNAAVYFPKDNPDEIAKVISEVINNPIKKTELINRGLEQIKHYSWEKMAKEIVNIYQDCAN